MPAKPPKRTLERLKVLHDADAESFDRLISALREVRPSAKRPALIAAVSAAAQDLSKEFVEGAVSLAGLSTPGELVEVVQRAADGLEGLEEGERHTLKARILTLTHTKVIQIAAQASGAVAGVRVYHRATLSPDIKPLIHEGSVAAAMVTQVLHIEYHTAEGHEFFALSLDGDDLKELREVLEAGELNTNIVSDWLKEGDILDVTSGG